MMDVQLRKVVEELEVERRACIELAAEVERLRGDVVGKSFNKTPTPDKSVGLRRDADNIPKDEKVDSSPEHRPGYEDLTSLSSRLDISTDEGKLAWEKDIIEATTPCVNFLTFDVDLLEIIEAENANDVA
ncbi:hypothetical protein C1H46_034728 [Malus baccata]|uniref:Uncharacterized protein n=1 Tax=Malus baccata TaxID=106549 RepID=A0A540KZQ8_MALBA|nr:hypothetical protein C1H46_034728 [Malus baccata]